jgi:hypothetical protein
MSWLGVRDSNPITLARASRHDCVSAVLLEAFTALTTASPDCAMAYWGIAMSARANPLAGAPDAAALERGQQAVDKAQAAGAGFR